MASHAEQCAYIRSVIGLPWESGAQGPHAFDCWGLARACEEALFGRALPLAAVDAASITVAVRTLLRHPERHRWAPVDRPSAGDLVEFRRAGLPHHVGVWLDADGGGVLHAAQAYGVAFERPLSLTTAGFGDALFYAPVDPA